MFLHLHEIMEWLYFHCSLSVCVSVYVSVCLSVNRIPAKRIHRLKNCVTENKNIDLSCIQTVVEHRFQFPLLSFFLQQPNLMGHCIQQCRPCPSDYDTALYCMWKRYDYRLLCMQSSPLNHHIYNDTHAGGALYHFTLSFTFFTLDDGRGHKSLHIK